MKKIKTRSSSDTKKLLLSFVVLIIMVFSIMGLGLYSSKQTQAAAQENSRAQEVIGQLEKLQKQLITVELNQLRYTMTKHDQYVIAADDAALAFQTTIADLMRSLNDQDVRFEQLREIQNGFTRWFELIRLSDAEVIGSGELIQQLKQTIVTEQEILMQLQQDFHQKTRLIHTILIIGNGLLLTIFGAMTYGGNRWVHDFEARRKTAEQSIRAANESMKGVIEATRAGTWEWDLTTGTSICNDRWAQMIGYSRDELGNLPHDTWRSFIHPDDIEQMNQKVEETLQGKQEFYEAEFRMKHRDGHWVWIMDRGKVIAWSPEGRPIRMNGTHTDITATKKAETELRRSEASYRSLVEQMNQGLLVLTSVVDQQGNLADFIIESVNAQFAHIVRRTTLALTGARIREVVPLGADLWIRKFKEVSLRGTPQVFELSLDQYGKSLKLSAYVPEKGKLAAIVEDITQAKALQNQLWVEKGRLETTLLSVGDAVISTDESGKIILFNSSAEQLTGWREDQAMHLPISQVLNIIGEPIVSEAISQRKTIEASAQATLHTRDERLIAVEATASPILGPIGTVNGVIVVFRDNTEKRLKQQHMEELTFRDPLTGLRNRRAYEAEIKRLDHRRCYPLILVAADVNNLKLTNDAFGHDAGDLLLRTVASVLVTACRPQDIVARIGGDEFVLLLPNTYATDAEQMIDQLNEAFAQQSILDFPVAVSFGFAVKTTEEELLKDLFSTAENYMYRKKIAERPRNRKMIVDQLFNTFIERHPEEMMHARYVEELCQELAYRVGLSDLEVDQIALAGKLHDIGKVALQGELLISGGLTEEIEGTTVLRHPEVSFNILSAVPQYAAIGEIVLAHHERIDGNGYPSGLRGHQIPLGSQILGMCDYWAMLRSEKPTGLQLVESEAWERLQQQSGKRFAESLIRLFIDEVITRGNT